MTRKQFLSGLCSLTLAASILVPSIASAAPQRSSLVKGSGEAVYWLANNGRRYVFPNDRTFYTWFSPYDFASIDRISDAELASLSIGGNITYRPGSRLIKISTDPRVYAVDNFGRARWIESESVAIALYGSRWRTLVDDVPDAFFVNYDLGAPITSPAEFHPNLALTPDGDIR